MSGDPDLFDGQVKIILYESPAGKVVSRQLCEVVEYPDRIEGICLATHQHTTLHRHRIIERVDSAQQLIARLKHYRHRPPAPSQAHPREICFTGFASFDRERLSAVAIDYGFVVRRNVTQRLSYLCCGPNAGRTKLKKARTWNVEIINERQFTALLERGK